MKRLSIIAANPKFIGGVRAHQIEEIEQPAGGSIQIPRAIGKGGIRAEGIGRVPAEADIARSACP